MPGTLEALYPLYPLACVLLAAFAFAFNWATGHRGVFLIDQSAMFDGGWRVLQGQAPYKDILSPFGPLPLFIQAVFFRLFGVNWSATVLPACVFNTLGTLSAIRIVRLLGGGSRLLALCGGLATAICFQAAFGTLWFEQTAMFFDFLALQAVVESFHASGYRRGLWQFAGGVSLILAVLSKQNYGAFFVPVVFAVLVAGELPDVRRACRSVFWAGAGMVVAIAIFLGWVWVFSDFSSFVYYAFVVAREIGRSRLTARVIAMAFSFNITPNRYQVDLIGGLAGSVALLLAVPNFRAPAWREMAPACAAAMLLPLFRSFTQASTDNDWQNNFAFAGLAVCLGVSLLLRIISSLPAGSRDASLRLPSARTLKICLFLVAGVWGAVAVGYVGRAAWIRSGQGFNQDTRFRYTVRVRGMERLRWGEPTEINSTTILRKSDFENVVSYLSAKKLNFYVMGDSSILYGLLGVPSPQPLLYFVPSHSFMKEQIPRLDDMMLSSLERNRIGVVVREKVMWISVGYPDMFALFPRTLAWFTAHFDHASDFGNYEIWERRPDAPR